MSFQAQLVMLAWLPIVFYLFKIYAPRKATILSFIGGLLFLPERAGFRLPLIPDYQGMAATCYGIMLAIYFCDRQRLQEFQPAWIDLPMTIWCICPIFSSLSNELGLYDGVNEAINRTVNWGIPYFLGRFYLNNLDGHRELTLNIVKGGLLYLPLCLYEGRMSPQLHNIIYGYYPHSSGIAQTYRLGGFRPMVFMEHGLMVGMWMMVVTLIAFWLWQAKTIQAIWQISMTKIVLVLIPTFIWCRSVGTYGYFLYGLIILFAVKWLRTRLALILLILGIIYYLYTSVIGHFDSSNIVSLLGEIVNPERAQSLGFRFENEAILAEHARDKLIFGWGGWGRNRVYAENWHGIIEDIAITDSLWILALGINGLVGLLSLMTSLFLPIIRFCFCGYGIKTWFDSKVAPAAVLMVVLLLFVFDCLLNDMFNPIFPLIAGGLAGLKLPEKPNQDSANKYYTKNQRYKYKGEKTKILH